MLASLAGNSDPWLKVNTERLEDTRLSKETARFFSKSPWTWRNLTRACVCSHRISSSPSTPSLRLRPSLPALAGKFQLLCSVHSSSSLDPHLKKPDDKYVKILLGVLVQMLSPK